jgi:predicted kinase
MKVIILVGAPGSGKSTYAEKYLSTLDPRKIATVVNQDSNNGDRAKTWESYKTYLDAHYDVVIVDRCNINKDQRSPWINYARQCNYEIEAVYLHCPTDICIARVLDRKGHATIKDGTSLDKVVSIVSGFKKSFEMPELVEGFDKIEVIKNG